MSGKRNTRPHIKENYSLIGSTCMHTFRKREIERKRERFTVYVDVILAAILDLAQQEFDALRDLLLEVAARVLPMINNHRGQIIEM